VSVEVLTMPVQFSKFLNGLPVRAGYCVDCLSQMYGEPVETIDRYFAILEPPAAKPIAAIVGSTRIPS
jgi:hypothetical protein